MSVTVDFHGKTAIIENYRWRSEDRSLARMLNVLLNPDGPPARPGDSDLMAATAAAAMLGGTIVDQPDPTDASGDIDLIV